jgi:hypothetical protein
MKHTKQIQKALDGLTLQDTAIATSKVLRSLPYGVSK